MCFLSCLTEVEGGPSEGFSLKDGEPDLDLIEPGGLGRSEVELHVWVPLKPAIILRLMGIEIVEDDVDGGVRIVREDIVHEIEEFDPAATILVGGGDLAGRHFKGRKEGRSAIALIVMTMTRQSPAIWQLQISLGALERLDRGLFVDTDDDRVLRRCHVEPHHIGSLADELRIFALAPGLPPGEINLLAA